MELSSTIFPDSLDKGRKKGKQYQKAAGQRGVKKSRATGPRDPRQQCVREIGIRGRDGEVADHGPGDVGGEIQPNESTGEVQCVERHDRNQSEPQDRGEGMRIGQFLQRVYLSPADPFDRISAEKSCQPVAANGSQSGSDPVQERAKPESEHGAAGQRKDGSRDAERSGDRVDDEKQWDGIRGVAKPAGTIGESGHASVRPLQMVRNDERRDQNYDQEAELGARFYRSTLH